MSEITNQENSGTTKIIKLRLPFDLWFSLVWTILAIILGAVIFYLKTQSFTFTSFFITNYSQWLSDFVNIFYSTPSTAQIFSQYVFQNWYYFLISGGLISLIIEIIILPFRFKSYKVMEEINPNLSAKPFSLEHSNIQREKQIEENLEKINEWLASGLKFLSESNLDEAELIYSAIRKEYSPDFDPHAALQRRIMSFYEEILAERKEQDARKK